MLRYRLGLIYGLEIGFLCSTLGEHHHNLGFHVANMGSLCFYMLEDFRFFFLGGGRVVSNLRNFE